jgi:hypothetical protein
MTKRVIVHDLGLCVLVRLIDTMLEIDFYERVHSKAVLEGVRHARKSSNMHSHYYTS